MQDAHRHPPWLTCPPLFWCDAQVVLHKVAFFKDVGFYLAAVSMVAFCLVVGKVGP